MSSSQLTNSIIFQRGWNLNHQPADVVNLGMDAEERATALTEMIQQELQKRISLEEELKARGVSAGYSGQKGDDLSHSELLDTSFCDISILLEGWWEHP